MCHHNKRKSTCKICSPRNYCGHDRIQTTCKECNGGGITKKRNKRKITGVEERIYKLEEIEAAPPSAPPSVAPLPITPAPPSVAPVPITPAPSLSRRKNKRKIKGVEMMISDIKKEIA
jgi:hypothetical protein